MAAQSPATDAPATAAYELSGVVISSAGAPIAEAEITAGAGAVQRRTATGADGRFTLGNFAAGRLTLRVRRLGYAQRVMEVETGADRQSAAMVIVLEAVPLELEEVLATTDPSGRLRGFYERRQQRGSFGTFMDQDEILRRGARNASDLFRAVPGALIQTAADGRSTIRMRGCQPMVRLDGQRVPGAELDELVSPEDIAAIEFYHSSAGIPVQFVERGNRLCGLILVWTKTQ